jgi:hypothetical protein
VLCFHGQSLDLVAVTPGKSKLGGPDQQQEILVMKNHFLSFFPPYFL